MSGQNTSPTTFGDKGAEAPPGTSTQDDIDKGTEGQMSDEELLHLCWKEFEDYKNYKFAQVSPADWKRYVMVYMAQHWNGMQKEWQSTPTIPLSTSAVHAILSVITDNRPEIAVIARQPENEIIATVIQAIVEWLWEYNDCDVKLPGTMLNTLILGNGFWKVLWDPAKGKGKGDISIINIDPTCMFFNPEATSIDDADVVMHVEQISLRRVAIMWPDKAEEVTAKIKEPQIVVDRPQVGQRPGGVRAQYSVPTTTQSDVWQYPTPFQTKDSPANKKDTVTVMERWELDKKTLKWKKSVCTPDVVLEPMEETDFEIVPIGHFADYKMPWTLWASGEIQLVENLQYEVNRRRGMILDILRYCALPALVYDPGAGVDIENIEMQPGVAIPAEGGPQSVSWMVPQVDLSGLFQVNDRDKKDMNDILGNVEMIQGTHPPGVDAGIALEQLADAASTRLRPKIRLMEATLRRVGRILIHYIQKYYTAERVFRVVGQETGNQFFSINTPAGMEPGGVDAQGQPQMQPKYGPNSNHIPPDAEFDVRIGAGSTLPVSKSAKFQQAITLFDRGCLPPAELLRAAGWDKWQQISQQMQQQQAAQAQAQAGPQQGTPSGAGGQAPMLQAKGGGPGAPPPPSPQMMAQLQGFHGRAGLSHRP